MLGTEARQMTRYRDIIHTLTHHCRLLTAEQIATHWFAHTVSPVKITLQFLRRQERQGLLRLEHTMVHPPLELCEPLVHWQPEMAEEPNWQSVAWRVQSRWNQCPVRSVIVSATHRARIHSGGPIGGRPIRQTEMSHDVSLAELWLRFRTIDPTVASSWIPEDALSGIAPNGKKPDGLITVAGNEIAVELAGKAYSAKRLAAIHAAHRHRHYRLY